MDSQQRRMILLAAAGIAGVTLAAYATSFAGVFVLDDLFWIVDNPLIRRLWPPADLLQGGRPVLTFSLAVNYALDGLHVWGYHAVNLGIHILAAWTLFGLLRRTLLLPAVPQRFSGAAPALAFAVALLWAVHPLLTMAVTYVIQRGESLAGLFYLLTLYCVLRAATAERRSRVWYCAAIAACVLGMATKEIMVTAPVMVLLYDRTFLSVSLREALARRWPLYLALAATWCVPVWILIGTGFYGHTAGFAVAEFSSPAYLATQPGVIAHYLRLAFWPVGLCLDYGWPPAQTVGQILPAALLIGGLALSAAWLVWRRSGWGFLGAWFFLILAPTSSIVPIRDAAFEHRMYSSLAAVVAGVVLSVWAVWNRVGPVARWPRLHGTLLWLLLVAVTFCAACTTALRNVVYHSAMALGADTIRTAPHNPRAHYNLGVAYDSAGQTPAAMACYRRAIVLRPAYPDAHHNLGKALAERGAITAAIDHYRRALAGANLPQTHNSLANALLQQHKRPEAIEHYRQALCLRPEYVEAHYGLGNALAESGRTDEAIAQYRLTLRYAPCSAATHVEDGKRLSNRSIGCAVIHNNLGLALAEAGKIEDAMASYRQALAAKPDYVEAHYNLGLLLCRTGRPGAAVRQWQAGLQANPTAVPLLNAAARVLATCPQPSVRNGAEALTLAHRARQLTAATDPVVLDTLAAAYAETGRFAEAGQTAQQALSLATARGEVMLAAGLEQRRRLYQHGQPYREVQ